MSISHFDGELHQFVFAELAVRVGIKTHRIFHKTFWIRWSHRSAVRSARRSFAASRFTTTVLLPTARRTPFAFARWTISRWTISARFAFATWRSVWTSFTVTSWASFRARRSNFIVRQLSITILVERLQSGCRIVDLLFGDLSIVIFVQSIHDWMRRTRSILGAAFTARWRTIGAAFTGRWLGQNIHRDSDAQQCHRSTG